MDHIESFMTLMPLQMTPNEVLCRAFPTTLKGAARVWFSKIHPKTIANFEQHSKGFVYNFIRGQRHTKPTSHFLNIQQVEGESLSQLGIFFFSITKSPSKIVTELLRKAQKYMNAKDAVLANEMKGKRKSDEETSSNCDKKKET